MIIPFINLVSGLKWGASAQFALDNAHLGMFCISKSITPDVLKLAEACRKHNSRFVLGFSINAKRPDMAYIRDAAGVTPDLALATAAKFDEWSPTMPVKYWVDIAEKVGAKWHCTYIHVRMAHDIKHRVVRDQLVEHSIPVWCLCGFMLARYVLQQSVPTYGTALRHYDLARDLGCTLPALRDYLEPLEIYSGADGNDGLSKGTLASCMAVGFKGCVAFGPWADNPDTELPDTFYEEPKFYKHYNDLTDNNWRRSKTKYG